MCPHALVGASEQRSRSCSQSPLCPLTQTRPGDRVRQGKDRFGATRRKSKVDEARDILANIILSHVPVSQYNFQAKARAGV